MSPARIRSSTARLAPVLRFAWAIVSAFVVVSIVFGLAALPAVLFWQYHTAWEFRGPWVRIVVLSMSLIPAYLLFAVALMVLSAGACRLFGWRTPRDAEMRIAEFGWPLIDWGRYMILTHVVRVFAGTLFRATPLWGFYLKLNGAQLGRGVWINSLYVNDHCMLDFGDGVVIGDAVHLSGHTVERGYVKTASVRLAAGVTVGLESIVGIGTTVGAHTQIGALSLVPKNSVLEPDSVYVGIPVRRIETSAPRDAVRTPG
jgi:acetyltransferase-like isoleucine patch superfamily enzyme